jgi:hypothetical protein
VATAIDTSVYAFIERSKWRKRVGVEPTVAAERRRPPVLKTGEFTGTHSLPFVLSAVCVAAPSDTRPDRGPFQAAVSESIAASMIPSRSFMYEARVIWDSTGTIRRATRTIDEQSQTIRGQFRDAIRTAEMIEMMADDAKEPPTDKWFGSPSR